MTLSGWGIIPMTLPAGLQIPAMSDWEPLGFHGYFAADPSGQTYLNTTWSLSSSFWTKSGSMLRSLPSAWAEGMARSFFSWIPEVNMHFPRLSFLRTVGLHSNLPESLVYRAAVGTSDMVPSRAGRSPSSTRIWNPLQTPRTGFPASTNLLTSKPIPAFILAAKMAPART